MKKIKLTVLGLSLSLVLFTVGLASANQSDLSLHSTAGQQNNSQNNSSNKKGSKDRNTNSNDASRNSNSENNNKSRRRDNSD